MRRSLAAFLAAFALLPTGCLSLSAFGDFSQYCAENPTADQCTEELPASVVFYALLGDYIRIKQFVLAYVSSPEPRDPQVLIRIQQTVDEADRVVAEMDQLRQNGSLTTTELRLGATTLRTANKYLKKLVVSVEAPPES